MINQFGTGNTVVLEQFGILNNALFNLIGADNNARMVQDGLGTAP